MGAPAQPWYSVSNDVDTPMPKGIVLHLPKRKVALKLRYMGKRMANRLTSYPVETYKVLQVRNTTDYLPGEYILTEKLELLLASGVDVTIVGMR